MGVGANSSAIPTVDVPVERQAEYFNMLDTLPSV